MTRHPLPLAAAAVVTVVVLVSPPLAVLVGFGLTVTTLLTVTLKVEG